MVKAISKKNQKSKGIVMATLVAVLQGSESLLIPFLVIAFSTTILALPAFSFATFTIRELVTFAFSAIYLLPRIYKTFFKKVFTSKSLFFVLSAILGTSFGNLFLILAINFAGSTLGTVLTLFYPLFSITISKFVFREKENIFVWIGFFVAIIGGALFVTAPLIFEGSSTFSRNQILGVIFGLLTAFFWGIEGILIKKGLQTTKGKSFSEEEIAFIRTSSTSIFSLVVLLGFGNLFGPSQLEAYELFASFFQSWEAILIISAIGVIILLLRIFHVQAINNVGPKATALIDSNYFIIIFSLSYALAQIQGPIGEQFSSSLVDPIYFLFIILTLVGIILAIYFYNPMKVKNYYDFHS